MDSYFIEIIKQYFAHVHVANGDIVQNGVKTSMRSVGIDRLQRLNTWEICNVVRQEQDLIFELHVSKQVYYTGLVLTPSSVDGHLAATIRAAITAFEKQEAAFAVRYQALLDRTSDLVLHSNTTPSKIKGITGTTMIATRSEYSIYDFENALQINPEQNKYERVAHFQLNIRACDKEWLPNFTTYCKSPVMSELKTYCLCGTYDVSVFDKAREVLNTLGAKEVAK